MTLIMKLSRAGHTRRLMFEYEPTWAELSTQIAQLEGIPEDGLAVSYIDTESDLVTISSEAELADYFEHFLRDGEVARFTIHTPHPPARPTNQAFDDSDGNINTPAGQFNFDIGPESSVSTKSDWEEIRSPQAAPTTVAGEQEESDGRSEAGYGSTFWGGLDEAFLPTNARLYQPEGPDLIPSLQAVRANPDILMDVSRLLSPRSTATLIHFLDDSDSEIMEPPPRRPPPRKTVTPPKGILSPKGKAREFSKEVAFNKPIATARPSSSQSLRGSAADPKDVQVPAPTLLPEVAAQPEVVAHPVILDASNIPPITKTEAPLAEDPPAPTVPPVTTTTQPAPPNVVTDIASLITAFQTALLTQPEVGAGLRHFIRSAVAGSPEQAMSPEPAGSRHSRSRSRRAPSEAPTETTAQLKNVIKTLKGSIAAQSVAGDDFPDNVSQAPSHYSRGRRSTYEPPVASPPRSHLDVRQPRSTRERSRSRHSHSHTHRPRDPSPAPPPPPIPTVPVPEMGGGPAPPARSPIPTVPVQLPVVPVAVPIAVPPPPPPPAPAPVPVAAPPPPAPPALPPQMPHIPGVPPGMGVWVAPQDGSAPYFFYQPYTAGEPVPAPPPPPPSVQPPPPMQMQVPAPPSIIPPTTVANSVNPPTTVAPSSVATAVPPPRSSHSHRHGHGHNQGHDGGHGGVPRSHRSRRDRSPSRRSVTSAAPTIPPYPPELRTPAPPPPQSQQSMRSLPPPIEPVPMSTNPPSSVPAISIHPGVPSAAGTNGPVEDRSLVPIGELTHEEALVRLSERKTQLELAKERYRQEKQKWKEEKEARRAARDREIERLTGRRVLSREEREERRRLDAANAQALAQAQLMAQQGPQALPPPITPTTPVAPISPIGPNPNQYYRAPSRGDNESGGGEPTYGIRGSAALNSTNPMDVRPNPTTLAQRGIPYNQQSRPPTITEPPPYAVPQPRTRSRAPTATGRSEVRTPTQQMQQQASLQQMQQQQQQQQMYQQPPPPPPQQQQQQYMPPMNSNGYPQDLKPGSSMAVAAQAERLIDKLEDMGFSPSTHPRLQEIAHDFARSHPFSSDEEALPQIMEAIVSAAPSTSGTYHDYR